MQQPKVAAGDSCDGGDRLCVYRPVRCCTDLKARALRPRSIVAYATRPDFGRPHEHAVQGIDGEGHLDCLPTGAEPQGAADQPFGPTQRQPEGGTQRQPSGDRQRRVVLLQA